MKVECQSCGAAYKIADQKVQGRKVFKIKCKKCPSEVVVRNDAVWHVVLDGEQQGPFGIAQVRDLLAVGNIDADTYVWRDGYESWLPLHEVGELASVFSAGPSQAPEADLDVAPEPAKVGARNDSSALFSLATLQHLSGPKDAGSVAAADDSSGLIDINKLAGALGVAAGARSKSSVDDILTVCASGGLSSPLAAPVLAPVAVPAPVIVAPPRSAIASTNTTGALIAAAVIVSLGGLGAMALYLRRGEPVAPMFASNTETRTPVAAAAIAERAPTPTASPERAPTPVPVMVPTPAPQAVGGRDHSHDHDHRSSAAAHAPTPIAPSPPPAAPAPLPVAMRPPAGRERSLDEVMRQVVAAPDPTPPTPPAPVAVGSDLPALPARPDVAAALRGVGPAVRLCGTGQGGTATVTVVFNSQGGVNTANVAPPAAGTAVGSCVARAVRGAHLSPFARPTFSVTFPFALD